MTIVFIVLTLIEHARMFVLHNRNEMIAVLLCNMTVDDESIKSRIDRYMVAFL